MSQKFKMVKPRGKPPRPVDLQILRWLEKRRNGSIPRYERQSKKLGRPARSERKGRFNFFGLDEDEES
jgi:hypothetical protein